jgi:hypothetical protein
MHSDCSLHARTAIVYFEEYWKLGSGTQRLNEGVTGILGKQLQAGAHTARAQYTVVRQARLAGSYQARTSRFLDQSTMGKGGGPGGRGHQIAKKAMITNPGQLRKNVQRAMRKLLDKKLVVVCTSISQTCVTLHAR